MIFLAVGTQFPFDRLVKAVDNAVEKGVIEDRIYGQIGNSRYQPRNFDYADFLKKEQFENYVKNATYLISHAGMGIITMALEYNRPILVMPRCKKHDEVVNDHQVAIARKFEGLGHILAAYHEQQLSQKIIELRSFIPRKRHVQTESVANRIANFLKSLANE